MTCGVLSCQVLRVTAAEGQVGEAGGPRPEGEGGSQTGDSEKSTSAAGKSAAQERSGSVITTTLTENKNITWVK